MSIFKIILFWKRNKELAILEAASKIKQEDSPIPADDKKETENPQENVQEKKDDLLEVS